MIHRLNEVAIPGISVKLEDRRSDLEVHDDRWLERLDAADLNIQVSSYSDDPVDVKQAQDIENFLRAYHAHDSKGPADRRRKGQMVRYGPSWKRICFTKEIIDKLAGAKDEAEMSRILQESEFSVNIFRSECPDIQTVAQEPDGSVVIELGERKPSELLRAYPDLEGEYEDTYGYLTSLETAPEGSSQYQGMVTYYHLEDAEYIYDVCAPSAYTKGDGQVLQCYPNPLKRPWYTFSPGKEKPELAPVERYRPLIGPLYEIAFKLQIYGTLLASGALRTGRPAYQLVKQGGRAANSLDDFMGMPTDQRPTLEFDVMDDEVQSPPEGFEYKVLPTPDYNWLLSAYQEAKREMAEYGFPAPLSPDQSLLGQSASGAQAAYGIEQAKFFVEPPLRNLAKAYVQEFLIVLGLIRELKLKVAIRALPTGVGSVRELVKLDGATIKEVDIECSFDAKTATMEYAARQSDAFLMQIGAMPMEDFMANRWPDPIEKQKKIDRELMDKQMRDRALTDALTTIDKLRMEGIDLIAEAAAAAGITNLPDEAEGTAQPPDTEGVVPMDGGPAPGALVREQRPPIMSVAGAGAPIAPPTGMPVP